ncbi:30S ribosomal protein S10 [endosymbiont GvMRE of Glomus versiforme]|uniref:30S ribosomal protein S10 n=1 Tax=endosymbiont GvMRE of Glomus versiforme TaxID=2039283 RepID=UPI001558AB40|nr:30S ribosomal protein S10 [endosymbiont GvMRE of Glomus versiforme]
MNEKLKITIYGYDKNTVEEATRLITNHLSFSRSSFKGPIPLPNKYRSVTLLASPFKHKRAQEKFGQENHKRVIYLFDFSSNILKSLKSLGLPNTINLEFWDLELKKDV